MVNQPCMMRPNAPYLSFMTLAADGAAVTVSFTLRAWTLVEAATLQTDPSWKRHVTRNEGHVSIRIPIVRSGTAEWFETVRILTTLNLIVFTLRWQKLDALVDEPNQQLVWIHALQIGTGNSGCSVLASPVFASFIREADDAVFARATAAMVRAERMLRGTEDIPLTRRVSKYHGALHLLVGDDCACLGVSACDLPQSEHEGWETHSHHLRSSHHILLVLVALAALEDEYRARCSS